MSWSLTDKGESYRRKLLLAKRSSRPSSFRKGTRLELLDCVKEGASPYRLVTSSAKMRNTLRVLDSLGLGHRILPVHLYRFIASSAKKEFSPRSRKIFSTSLEELRNLIDKGYIETSGEEEKEYRLGSLHEGLLEEE